MCTSRPLFVLFLPDSRPLAKKSVEKFKDFGIVRHINILGKEGYSGKWIQRAYGRLYLVKSN